MNETNEQEGQWINRRELVQVDVPAPSPRELPDLRLTLMHQWEPGQLFDKVTRAKHIADLERLLATHGNGVPFPVDDEVWFERNRLRGLLAGEDSRYRQWEHETLRLASLYWVAQPMCELHAHVMQQVPEDTRWLELPEVFDPDLMRGFAVLEQPYLGHTADTAERIRVAGVLWGPVTLPPIEEGGESVLGMAIASYGCFSITPDQLPPENHKRVYAYRAANGAIIHGEQPLVPFERVWYPMGRADWPLTQRLDEAPYPMDENKLASYMEDRRFLASLWTLLHQEGIASTVVEAPARHVRRRVERAGLKARAADVRLVVLRRLHEQHESSGEGRKLDHRVLVGGHFKMQAFGPGRSLRKRIYINPYLKGPGDDPPMMPPTVRVWKR